MIQMCVRTNAILRSVLALAGNPQSIERRHDIQYNDNRQFDTQHNDFQPNNVKMRPLN